jgi:type IV secretory pathway VirB6-like protein
MIIADDFLSNMFLMFVDGINKYAVSMIKLISSDFSTFARSAVILYCAYFGINLMQGKFGDRTKEILTSIVLVIILHTLIIESDLYISMLNGFKELTMSVAGFFISKGTESSKNFEDLLSVLDKVVKTSFSLTNSTEDMGLADFFRSLPLLLFELVIFLLCLACFIIYLVLCLLAIFGIHLLFIIGSVPIFFAAFKETRHVFFSWLRALICDALIIIIASIFMAVCLSGLETTLRKFLLDDCDALVNPHALVLIIYCLVTCGILLKAPDYAANLAGSSSGSSSVIAGGVAVATGRIIKMSFQKGMGAPAISSGIRTVGKGLKYVKGVYDKYV